MIIKIYKSILFNIIFKEFRKFTYNNIYKIFLNKILIKTYKSYKDINKFSSISIFI